MGFKICSKCKESKNINEFHLKGGGKRRNDCSECVRSYGKLYRLRNRELIRKKKREYHKNNPHIKRRSYLKLEYGISMGDYEELLKKQGYKCKICKSNTPRCTQHKHLYVDHDHSTGKIRGLLCNRCNMGIGHLEDNVEFFKEAIKYLEKDH